MAKKEQIKGFEEAINNIPLVIDPCKMCKIYKEKGGSNMSMINPGTYEFTSLYNVIDFVKPLIIEGYPVAINTVYKEFTLERSIDKFEVNIGQKGCKMEIQVEEVSNG